MTTTTNKPVALVTGGSRGIGLGIATSLAKAGYALAINGVRSADRVQDTLATLKELKTEVIYCQGDIGETEDRHRMMSEIKAHFGRLNLLVNNAGVAPKERNDILKTTESSYEWVMRINLQGPYFLTQAAANWMIEQREADSNFFGCIINISSISATMASTNRGEYCISKAGMSMLTMLFASRLGEYHIPVYEIRPGLTLTDMTAGVKEKYDKLIEDGLTIQPRWGLPEDMGKAVTALATGQFPYSTGQVIMVEGGMTIQRL